ncbi:hypothetical protein BDA96_04G237000 [Sorghum bicolor]|uniref:Uncharacterized protein n=2 Tax=Sorghum bicolor TaxID=4558 RepID=A0A921R4I7_SORBI|nr:uncharacterized protein LOC8074782 isoform X2 [Sorghum bicolor]KAG0533954.1 hypothetical protein BDA96_04G237000 [Sorghum bicolor]OQU85353.1 hypothetical protein SORBI_3004G222700 [Sorghum bicolor]|eukprot:XP_021314913.1 uncharacterized protein LOC8074782 isoform X2 [Sorghum bicolor]
MDQGMELRGCVCRIKSSALELLSMEEDLTTDLDDDLWDLVRRDLQLKATFLYIDLNRVIACNECEERREEITLLANDFFYFMDEVNKSQPDHPDINELQTADQCLCTINQGLLVLDF